MGNYVLTPNIGNARGNYAVDFNFVKTAADMVASGYASILIGGGDNKAGAGYASVMGGFNNVANGEASTVVGAYNECDGANSFVFGYSNKSSAFTSFLGGSYNQLKGSYHFAFGEYGTMLNDLNRHSTILNCQTYYIGTDSSDGDAQAPTTAIFSGGFAWPVHEGEQVRNSRFYEAIGLLKAVQHSIITMFYEGIATNTVPCKLQTNGDMANIPDLGKDLTMLHDVNPVTGVPVPMAWSLNVNWVAIDLVNNRVITGEDTVMVNRVNSAGGVIFSVETDPIAKAGDSSLNSSVVLYATSTLYPNSITIRFRPSYSSNFRVAARVQMLQDISNPV